MASLVTNMRSNARVKPHAWRDGEDLIPGASVRRSKANLFIPFAQLREVADQLHDIADEYEEAERAGTLGKEEKVDDWK